MLRSSHLRLRVQRTAYPASWPRVRLRVQQAASFKCVRCGQSHNPKVGHRLQVHHLDMNKANLAEWNLVPLCRPCRLMVQARVDWEQGRFFPVEDWLIPYRVTYLATQGISEPWLGALGGLEPSHSNSLERRLEIDAPSPSDIPINGDLGLHGSLRRLMGRATHIEKCGDAWLEVYQCDGDYLVFRLGDKDSLNGDYLGQYSLLETAKNRVRKVQDGISDEPLVHLQGTRIPWGVA
jgi:hypothetical protein